MRSRAPLRTALLLILAALPASAALGQNAAAVAAEEPCARTSRVREAIARGVEFLIGRQEKDGSWGSPRRTKGLNIYAPAPGAHDAFRTGVTSLCVLALIEAGEPERNERVRAAVRRGEDWLIANLPRLRRATPDALYNVWGHAYAIQALARSIASSPEGSARRAAMERRIREQIGRLERYETVAGGWGYYDFEVGSQRPAGSPTCFTTGTVLIAFAAARDLGIEVPRPLVDRALASIRRQQKPDFSYLYGEYLWWEPMRGINRAGGSLGRSQVCNVARRRWGDREVTDEVIRSWVDRLLRRNLWLDIGRKRPVPHEAWFQVAGYFFYYGHYYGALAIEELDRADRPELRRRLAEVLVPLQEKDGSWWDFPFYDYHQPYGTAFALMALARSAE